MTTDAAEHREDSGQPGAPGIASHSGGSVAHRAWRAFRRWQHARPFWGGLFVLLGAGVYYFSGHLSISPLVVHIGPQGFLSYVIPLVLLLCGLLLWLTPAQRIFYGVIAAATAVYGMIGLNLGGFGLGMLFGMVGGALGASWTTISPPPTATAGRPAGAGPEAGPGAGPQATGLPQDELAAQEEPLIPFEPAEPYQRAEPVELYPPAEPVELAAPAEPVAAAPEEPDEPDERDVAPQDVPPPRPRGGSPLTDTLPTSTVSPLHQRSADGDPPELPRRGPRTTGLSVIALTVLAIGAAITVHGVPANAAPCPVSPTPSSSRTPTPHASPTATATNGNPVQGLIGGLLGGVTGLLGGTNPTTPAADPTAGARTALAPAVTPTCPQDPGTPAPGKSTGSGAGTPTGGAPIQGGTPSGSPTPRKSGAAASATPSASASPKPLPTLPADADQPPVSDHRGTITTDRLTMVNLAFLGLVELPLAAGGSVQAIEVTMDSAVLTPFELDFPAPGGQTGAEISDKLTISGNVRFYFVELHGDLLGVPLTLSTDLPIYEPLPLPTPVTLTGVTIKLAYVHADTMLVEPLHGANKT